MNPSQLFESMELTGQAKNNRAKVYVWAGLVLLIRLLLLPFAQATDADAVSRVLIAADWKEHPSWIMQSVWGPFHFYLTGFGLMIWNNTVLMPPLMNVVLSCLTLLPFYYFTRREFNETGAFMATVFLSICPVLFRNSFLAMSETPYLFLTVSAMNFISKGIRGDKMHCFLIAGMSMTLASGFRYEAWLLILLFGLVILLSGNRKYLIVFGCASLLFPLIWIMQSYRLTGQFFYGFGSNALFTMETIGNNEHISLESYLRRIWFFPFSWMIALGPPAALITIHLIVSGTRNTAPSFCWTIPFWGAAVIILVNSLLGTLILQHRFTGTLIILGLPFFALYFQDTAASKIRNAWLFAALTIGLSFVWNTGGVKMLPRLRDQEGKKISGLINSELASGNGLIIDFWNWENSYFIALQSELPLQNLVIVPGTKNSALPENEIIQLLNHHPDGIVLIKKDSPLFSKIYIDRNWLHFYWMKAPLRVETIFTDDKLIVMKYSYPDPPQTDDPEMKSK